MSPTVLKISLLTTPPALNNVSALRGYIASSYPDNLLLHQHQDETEKELIYSYPRIQYKFINNMPIIIGIEEGAEILKDIAFHLNELNLKGKLYKIINKKIEENIVLFEECPTSITYTFITPWLALNEKNYEKYQKYGTWAKRKELLEKILIGNIISMSKSLGYTVPEPIKANIDRLKEIKTSLKGIPMLGFLGTFSVNFEIPDYWGIGKSVSRGFGTIVKQSTEG